MVPGPYSPTTFAIGTSLHLKRPNLFVTRINIGDFDVKRIIGRGNFADVKLAREKSSGHVYALKVVRKGGEEKVSAFYEEERDIMARAASPWLTKLDYAFQVG